MIFTQLKHPIAICFCHVTFLLSETLTVPSTQGSWDLTLLSWAKFNILSAYADRQVPTLNTASTIAEVWVRVYFDIPWMNI